VRLFYVLFKKEVLASLAHWKIMKAAMARVKMLIKAL